MTPHDLLAAFEVLAEAPEGIARLRELVLQLAVRGKLVPQDPNDEPACVLLERIAVEKARLVKEGKISKAKPLPPVDEDEVPFAVPEEWVWCRAEHLFEFVTSGSRGWAQFYSKDGPVFLRIGNLDYGTTRLDLSNVQHVYPPANSEGTRTRTMPGDILVSITGDTGMVGLIPDGLDEAYINQHIAMCRPVIGTLPRYIAMAFTTPPLLDQLWGYQRGIKNSLGLDDIRILQCPLPPLSEQHRIVAKVDALMALLDRLEAARSERETTRIALRDASLAALRNASLAALRNAPDAEAVEAAWTRIAERMDNLFTAPTDVAPLRQTIHQLAVRGKLVPQDPSDEPACVLLERIAVEKARLVKEGKISKSKPLPPVEKDEMPFEVPEGWVWCRLGAVCTHVVDCLHRTPKYVKEGFPAIRTCDVEPGRLLVDQALRVDAETYAKQTQRLVPETGDVLYSREGGRFGIAAVIPPATVLCLSQRMMQFRCGIPMNPHYFTWFLNSPLGFGQASADVGGSASPHVNISSIRRFVLPLPPADEQHRIVAKVDALMALCDALEARLAAAWEAQAAFAAAAVHHLDV